MARNRVIWLKDKQALLAALAQHAIPNDGWGKTKGQLDKQIADGETTFAIRNGRLVRLTWRARADVYRTTPKGRRERLYEAACIVNGVTQRPSKGPSVSEKMVLFPRMRPQDFTPETPEEAIVRCFLEELGVVADPGRFVYRGAHTKLVRSPSSFPIKTIDFVHLFSYEIPFADTKEEYVEIRNRKRTVWRWKRSQRK